MDPFQDSSAAQARWLKMLRPGYVRSLFEYLPHTLFFAKNLEGQLMAGNRLFVERCGFQTEAEMVGRTDRDIFPPTMAEKYRADDLKVIERGEPEANIVELFPSRAGVPEWFITDKIPLVHLDGSVAGVCGTVRSYEGSKRALMPYLELSPVTEYLKEHYMECLPVADLARMVKMSVRQLERKFRVTFKTTPQRYIVRLRVLAACDLLVQSDLSITEIALQVGFYDHSAFSKQFSTHMGMPPREYRKRNGRRL